MGRKRDATRTDAILEAAAKLLLEVGFDRFRIQEVAKRAGCGTGAIYRRWPKKEALVAEAIRNLPMTPPPDTDDPVADMRVLIRRHCDGAERNPDRLPSMVAAMRADEGIETAIKEGMSLADMRAAIARVVGDDHPQLELLTELASALTLFRSCLVPETLDADAMTDGISAIIESMAPRD